MARETFKLVYDTEVVEQLKAIERKYHSLIREAIEAQLSYEPNVETQNRKPVVRITPFGARWELRCGRNNCFRVFYSVYLDTAEVHILAVGEKHRDRIYIGGKEVEL